MARFVAAGPAFAEATAGLEFALCADPVRAWLSSAGGAQRNRGSMTR